MACLACGGALSILPSAQADEHSEHGLGHIPFDFDTPFTATKSLKTLGPLPDHFDWREQGVVTPVEDQGSCGCCYAFSSLDNFESKILVDGGELYDFSDNNAKECPAGGFKCLGGAYWITANHYATHGTVLETCDPYSESITGCRSGCPYIKTLLEWRVISETPVASTDVLKSYIMTYGPIYSALNAGHGDAWYSEFRNYNGSYTLFYAGPGSANHAALIVGWDDSLSHAGGKGAWIAKNSWGSSWGGTCGYGSEGGYYMIAYGSAKIGSGTSFLHEWQDYDSRDTLLYQDEAGVNALTGFPPSLEAWEMCRYVPDRDYKIERAEFWTFDAVADADFYLYDSFDGSTLSGLLASLPDMSFENPGYHSVSPISQTLLHQGDDVYAVLKILDASPTATSPLTYDKIGPKDAQASYVSHDGVSWSEFTSGDLGIRLRVTTDMDLEGPTIDLGLVPREPGNSLLMLEARPSEAVLDTSVSVTVRGELVTMEAQGGDSIIYRGLHRVSGAGPMRVVARARDLAGNPGQTLRDFEVGIISSEEGGVARSADGEFEVAVAKRAFVADTAFMFISAGSLGEGILAAYQVWPSGPPGQRRFRDFVEVSVAYDQATAEPEHLCLARLGGEGDSVESRLDSFVDRERHRVVAYVDSLGLFGLLASGDVTSPGIRTSGVGIGPSAPNPFGDSSSILYEVGQAGRAKVSVFDVRGRLVAVLYNGQVNRGLHRTAWNGADSDGREVGSGVYYLVIESGGATSSAKVIKVN